MRSVQLWWSRVAFLSLLLGWLCLPQGGWARTVLELDTQRQPVALHDWGDWWVDESGASTPADKPPLQIRMNDLDNVAIVANDGGLPAGTVLQADGSQAMTVETGDFLRSVDDVGDLVVGASNGKPVYLREVARVQEGSAQPAQYAWFTPGAAASAPGAPAGAALPAVTLQVTKKPGVNAVDVAQAVRARLAELHGAVIPEGIEATVTRDYGETAAEKANKLIQKLAFATGSVILLVGLALGRREEIGRAHV